MSISSRVLKPSAQNLALLDRFQNLRTVLVQCLDRSPACKAGMCETPFRLLSLMQFASSLQAIEERACDSLAEISASEHPEERAAAGKALSLVLNGAASSVKASPGLGAKAAAFAGRSGPAEPPFPGTQGAPKTQNELIPASRFRSGGGIPQSSLFPMLQIVAMQEVASSTVELDATLHALLTAADCSDLRQGILEYAAFQLSDSDCPPCGSCWIALQCCTLWPTVWYTNNHCIRDIAC